MKLEVMPLYTQAVTVRSKMTCVSPTEAVTLLSTSGLCLPHNCLLLCSILKRRQWYHNTQQGIASSRRQAESSGHVLIHAQAKAFNKYQTELFEHSQGPLQSH